MTSLAQGGRISMKIACQSVAFHPFGQGLDNFTVRQDSLPELFGQDFDGDCFRDLIHGDRLGCRDS